MAAFLIRYPLPRPPVIPSRGSLPRISNLRFPVAAAGATTMIAGTALFDLTGRDADTLAIRFLTADSESFALTGKDADTFFGHLLTAESGSFLLKADGFLSLPGESADYASSPDASALDIVGDIDLIADLEMPDWSPAGHMSVLTKFFNAAGNQSYSLRVASTGVIILTWSVNGSTNFNTASTVVLPFANNTRHWIRATLDVDAGDTDHELTFYISEDGVNWTQLGDVVNLAGITSISSGDANINVGSHSDGASEWLEAKVYRAIIKDGIDGTVVFDADFTNHESGTLSFTESSSEAATVTINQSGSPVAEIIGHSTFVTIHVLGAESGSFILTGKDAITTKGYFLSADSVLFDLTGQVAGTILGTALTAESGSFSLLAPGYLEVFDTGDNYAQVPDSSALDVIGDIDLIAEIEATDWTNASQMIISKYADTGSERSYYLVLNGAGTISVFWSQDGGLTNIEIATSVTHGFVDGTKHWIRVTIDVDNGSGGFDVNFYTGQDGKTWTILGTTIVDTPPSPIFSSTAPVQIGVRDQFEHPFEGKIYRTIIKDGIDGTVVLDIDFRNQEHGTTSFTEIGPEAATVTIFQDGGSQAEMVGPIVFALGAAPLAADSGSFILTGKDAQTSISVILQADSGSFDLTGQDATTAQTAYILIADSVLFDLTGQTADLFFGHLLNADSIAFTLTGQDATTASGFLLSALSGSFDLTGQDAITRITAHVLTADSVLFDLTGQDATTSAEEILSADSGSFILTGKDAITSRTYILSAESESFTLTGQDAELIEFVETLIADSGFFSLRTATHLRLPGTVGNFPTTPDAAPLDITGDLDIRLDLSLDNWNQGLAGFVSKEVTNRSYYMRSRLLSGQTRVQLIWSEDGSAEITRQSDLNSEFSFSAGTRHSIRATLDVDNGASGHDVTFYKSEFGIDGPWTQVGNVITTAGITSIFSGASELRIGTNIDDSQRLIGNIYRVQIRNGIDGTIEFDADFNKQAEGATTFDEDSVNAAEVTINQSGSPQAEIVGDVSFSKGVGLAADSGSFVLTGQDADILSAFILSADSVAFTLTGQNALTTVGYLISAESGSFTLTGKDATTLRTISLAADSVLFDLTGQIANTFTVITLDAESGSFILTGQDATTAKTAHVLSADSALFDLTGQAATTLIGYLISAESGSFTLTGQDAISLVGYRLEALSGTFTLTGQDATTFTAIILSADSALFDLTGQDATTRISGEVLTGDSGSFILTGQVVDLLWSHLLTAAVGSFSLVGRDAELLVGINLSAESVSFTLTGQDAETFKSENLLGDSGSFILTGQNVLFVKELILIGESAIFTFTGGIADFLQGTVEVVPIEKSPNILFPKEVDELVIPDLQEINFRLDQFKDVELPDPLTIEINEFNALEPVSPTKGVARELFLYVDFSNTIQDIIDGKIEELTNEIKPYEVETHEWSREKEDLLSATEEQVEKFFDIEAGRGFLCASGVFSKDVSKFASKVKKELSRLNEKLYSTQTDLTKKNITSGLEAGNRAEAVVRTTDKNRQEINLNAAQFLIDVDFKVFEVHLFHHTSVIEVKKIKHSAYVQRIKGQLLKLEEREIAIQAHTLNQVERTKQVSMFNLAADFLNAQQGLKEIELDNFILENEIEKNKLLSFQAEIEKFSALINLNISRFNLYKAGIEFEESKVDRFKEEADVAGAQLDLQNAKTRSGSIRSETKLSIAQANLVAQAEKLRAARSRLDIAVTEGRAQTVRFSSDLLVYQASLKEWTTEVTAEVDEEISESRSLSDKTISELKDVTRINVNTIQFDTESTNIQRLGSLNAQVIAESADIASDTTINSELIHRLITK